MAAVQLTMRINASGSIINSVVNYKRIKSKKMKNLNPTLD